MTRTLPSERNTTTIERRIRAAAREILGRGPWETTYEHGHWWVINRTTGEAYDAVDAEGGRAVLGFDFESVGGGID